MRSRARAAALALVCLVLGACATQAPATPSEPPPGQAAPSAAAPSTAPTPTASTDGETVNDGTLQAPLEESLAAQEYWAQEAIVRQAAIEYYDLAFAVTPIQELAPEAPTCAPATWYLEVASGALSYDEYSLRATYALFNDEQRLGPLSEEVCHGEGLAFVEGMGMAAWPFWDAVSPQTKVAMWDYLGGGQPIESAAIAGNAEFYRAMTADLRARGGLD